MTLQNRSDDLMSGLGTCINDEGRYENTTTWDRTQTKKMEIVIEIKAHLFLSKLVPGERV